MAFKSSVTSDDPLLPPGDLAESSSGDEAENEEEVNADSIGALGINSSADDAMVLLGSSDRDELSSGGAFAGREIEQLTIIDLLISSLCMTLVNEHGFVRLG